ncbi:hypothetical protein K461DRAFT_291320 [Myriangium duriaei CBS 260.36]|uniref:Mediator of RNA polymerase II transcription subunit 12 n=1 Tax=Myriangium duriaei CBS 260.36 TaxID=1168546 RepID=A0A9P4MKK1_9PEZI|nr:hypothetical protein K461DRAFT_291320 [Myriangium duriaei CBS 260.36]
MTFDDADEADLEGQALRNNNMASGFGGFSSPALHKYAPLPVPPTIDSSNAATLDLVKDKTNAASRGSAGRPRGQEPPALAVSLKNDRFADYKPWISGSPEDILNDSFIRSGFADKAQSSVQNETNMARPAVWPNLKNKNGLPLLSMLFVQVMDKRQALGKCTAPSTFKPPPRVTLTDTKREAWLRDLASPDVPLRRLSRTIPHGIRGKVLLDQCFSKTVPLSRAIWLIKCVGANEIRAFRRKGISGTVAQSGELKWIREWTLCVEQFVAGTIGNCGQKEWKKNVQYTVRLTAGLFTEDLLDHQHFLNWLIDSFASSSSDMLPMWLLLVQLFWKNITDVQRRGQSLSEAIISQLATLKAQPRSVLESLLTILQQHLARLVREHKHCVIGLKDWTHARPILENTQAQIGDHQTRLAFHEVLQRNDRLNPSASSFCAAAKTTRLALFNYLDTLPFIPQISRCTEKCKELCTDYTELIGALVDWASSIYRTGHSRVYLVVSILRQLAEQGVSLEHGILTTFSNSAVEKSRDQILSGKIIAELVSTRHFNYGKYLQWLISTGAAWQKESQYVTLLFSVPLSSLSSQSISLRSAILNRLGLHTNYPADLTSIQMELDRFLQDVQPLTGGAGDSLLAQISDLQLCDKTTLCQWITERIRSLVTQPVAGKRPLTITPTIFSFVRTIFESALDFRSLATVLYGLIPTATTPLFVELAAVIEQNAAIFAAMGSLDTSTSQLLLTYARIRHLNQLDQISILSMISICRLQPSSLAGQTKRLEGDLLTFEQLHAAAVCSPASDSMLTVQNGQINADEDIDRMLSSGNTMDEQMLARLFSAIVERTVKWTVNGSTSLSNPCRWFSQLRAFDTTTFDRHMNNLISKLVANAGTDQVRAILISLVASGCLKFHETLSAFEKRLDSLEATSAPQLARFALGTLQTFLPLKDLDRHSRDIEIYRFRIAQKYTCDQNRATILRFVWHALSAPAEASSLLFSKPTLIWLSTCYIAEPEIYLRWLRVREPASGHRAQQLARLISAISAGVTTNEPNTPSEDGLLNIDDLIRRSDELRLPFVKLQLTRASECGTPNEGQYERVILASLQTAIIERHRLWPQLVGSVATSVIKTLRQRSWASIVQRADSYLQTGQDSYEDEADQSDLQVAEITASENNADHAGFIDRIGEILQLLTERLEDKTSVVGVRAGVVAHITSLIYLLITALPAASTTEQIPSSAAQRVFRSICQLMAQGTLNPNTTEPLLLDYATMLLRPFSTDILSAIYQKLPSNYTHDSRIRSILGIVEQETKWLSLASKVSIQQAQTASSSTSQAQAQLQPKRPPSSAPQSPVGQAKPSAPAGQDIKYMPYTMRKWELMQDPTPNVGENDAGISLTLFAARRVY